MNQSYDYTEIKKNIIAQLAKIHVEEFESQLNSNNFSITECTLNQSSVETIIKKSLQSYKFSY